MQNLLLAARRAAAVAGLFAVVSCVGSRELIDPTLHIQAPGGASELGVSTDYGIVFLGRVARSGEIEVTAWFGDGPSQERAVVEPVGGGLYTAETEIRLPSVALSFQDPAPGTVLRVYGRRRGESWQTEARIVRDERVDGLLLADSGGLRDASDEQLGAGVYVCLDDDCRDKRLIGLVSGRLVLRDESGERSYLTMVGPSELWRLVTHRRDLDRRRPWVYRPDIL